MLYEPNGRKIKISLTISQDRRKWLRDHSWVNAFGLLEDSVDKLRNTLKDNDKSLR